MAYPRLTDETLQEIVQAVRQRGSITEAADALGLPYATAQHRFDTARQRGFATAVPAHLAARKPYSPKPVSLDPLTSYDEARRVWEKELGMAKDRYKGPCQRAGSGERQRIAILPDLHAPFHERAMFAEFIARETKAKTAKVIAIGDISDSYALSRFIQYEWMPFRDEWCEVQVLMQALSEAFPQVEIVVGNHDQRLEKQLRTRLTVDMVEAVKYMTGGTLCPLSAMVRQFPNVQIAHHEASDGHHIDWFTTSGDAWLGHPEKWSKVPGSVLRFVEEWLADNELAMRLDRYSAIFVGHTHAMAMIPYRARQLLVETGCLCKLQGYQTTPKIGGRPQRRGYVWFYQDRVGHEWRTDLNSVDWVWFDVQAQAP